MTQQVQNRNAQMVDLLRQDFQHRREPNYAWSRAASMYLALPGLRAFWPMSANTVTPAANVAGDASGNVNWLINTNNVQYGYDSLAPYVEFDGVNQYLSRADGGAANWADITGTEAYIVAAQRGLTLGGWFYFNSLATTQSLITKWVAPVNQRSYALLYFQPTNQVFWEISVDGAAVTFVTATAAVSAGQWHFIVGRFNPSTELTLFIDDNQYANAVAIPASIFDSTSNFNVGAIANGTANYLNGRASMMPLCAAQLSDAIVSSLFEQTRAMYGV